MKKSKIKTKVSIRMENYEEHTSEIMDSIYENRTAATDVSIVSCDGQLFFSHRLVLCFNSDFLRKILEEVPNYAQPIISVPDIDAEILELVLRFIYTGEIHVPDNRLNDLFDAFKLLELKVMAPYGGNDQELDMIDPKTNSIQDPVPPVASTIQERMALLNSLRLNRQSSPDDRQRQLSKNYESTRDFLGAFAAQLRENSNETTSAHAKPQRRGSFKIINSVQVVETPKKTNKPKQCLTTLPQAYNQNTCSTSQNISETGAKAANIVQSCPVPTNPNITNKHHNKLLRPNNDLTTLANLQPRRDSLVENLLDLHNSLSNSYPSVVQNFHSFQINSKDFGPDLMDDSLDFIEANQWHAYNDPKNDEVDSAATMTFTTVEETSCWNDLMNRYPFQDVKILSTDQSVIHVQECNNNNDSKNDQEMNSTDEYRVVVPAVDDDVNLESFTRTGIEEDGSTESSTETASCCTSLDSGLQADDFPEHVENEIQKRKRELHEAVISALKKGERIAAITRKYKVSLTYVYRRKNWLSHRGELPSTHSRVSHRKMANEDLQQRLNLAINDIREGRLTQSEACQKYKVSEKTLLSRMKKDSQTLEKSSTSTNS